jgi:hypothetical protein
VGRAGRDTAFAALILLRCRDRIGPILDTIAGPRRIEAARAVAELDGLDDAHLKHALQDVVRREDAELQDVAARTLGLRSAEVPRAIRKWVAQAVGR